ncbi:MAG: ABC transporter substrate-binding protein [Lautropia sp.]
MIAFRVHLWMAAGSLAVAAGLAHAAEFKVGIVGPLSGGAAVYGIEPLEGAKFALEEIHKSGLLGSHRVTLVPADSAGNPGQAAQAARRMIESDNVLAILGSMTSAETQAMIEVTRAAGVPHLSPGAQDASLTKQGNKWFSRISLDADRWAEYAVGWIAGKHKAKSVYILARNDNYGRSLTEGMVRYFKDKQVNVLDTIYYEPSNKDFKPMLVKLRNANPDFIVLNGFYTDLGLVVKQIGELQIKFPIYTGTAAAIPQFADIAGPAANGAYGTAYYFAGSIDTAAGKRFQEGWRAKFKRDPSQYEGMGYDAMYVLAEAMRNADKAGKLDREGLRDAIYAIKDFEGGTGRISIRPNGDVERPVPFFRLKDRKLEFDFLAK